MTRTFPVGTRVGFYACGVIARTLVNTQREALDRLDTVFILCSFLPLLGVVTAFIPDLGRRQPAPR